MHARLLRCLSFALAAGGAGSRTLHAAFPFSSPLRPPPDFKGTVGDSVLSGYVIPTGGFFVVAAGERTHYFYIRRNVLYKCVWGEKDLPCLHKVDAIRALKTWHDGISDSCLEESLSDLDDSFVWNMTM